MYLLLFNTQSLNNISNLLREIRKLPEFWAWPHLVHRRIAMAKRKKRCFRSIASISFPYGKIIKHMKWDLVEYFFLMIYITSWLLLNGYKHLQYLQQLKNIVRRNFCTCFLPVFNEISNWHIGNGSQKIYTSYGRYDSCGELDYWLIGSYWLHKSLAQEIYIPVHWSKLGVFRKYWLIRFWKITYVI